MQTLEGVQDADDSSDLKEKQGQSFYNLVLWNCQQMLAIFGHLAPLHSDYAVSDCFNELEVNQM